MFDKNQIKINGSAFLNLIKKTKQKFIQLRIKFFIYFNQPWLIQREVDSNVCNTSPLTIFFICISIHIFFSLRKYILILHFNVLSVTFELNSNF